MASQPPVPRLPLEVGLAYDLLNAALAVVASARRRGGAGASDEGMARLAELALRSRLDIAEQEVAAALGPLPAKGAALVGAEKKGEEGAG